MRAAKLASWIGDAAHATAWETRAHAIGAAFAGAFWDSNAGAFTDTTLDRATHPQDANAFAASRVSPRPPRPPRALDDPWTHGKQDTGTASSTRKPGTDPIGAGRRTYASTRSSRTSKCLPGSKPTRIRLVLDQIRRTWGYMLARGPGTMWETIGPYGGAPTDGNPSWSAGWSSGAAPALTQYVLGRRADVTGLRHVHCLAAHERSRRAEGDVPTPHGPIHVHWAQTDRRSTLHVSVPPGTSWANRPGRPRWD